MALRDRGREPIGALVRVFYSNGGVILRRYGSAYNSAFSQVLGPLHFGVPAGIQVDKLSVRWPGDRDESFILWYRFQRSDDIRQGWERADASLTAKTAEAVARSQNEPEGQKN